MTSLNKHQGYFVVRRGHPLLALKCVPTLKNIGQFPLVSASRIPVSMLRQFLAGEMAKSASHSPAKSLPTIACESIAMIKRIAAETDAVGILPLNVVWDELQAGRLAVLSLVSPAMKVDFMIIRLAHRSLSPLGETFVRILQEADEEQSNFEQKNAPKIVGMRPPGAGSKANSATSGSLSI